MYFLLGEEDGGRREEVKGQNCPPGSMVEFQQVVLRMAGKDASCPFSTRVRSRLLREMEYLCWNSPAEMKCELWEDSRQHLNIRRDEMR
jgi:hypothetical protein